MICSLHFIFVYSFLVSVRKSCILRFKMQKQGFAGVKNLGSFRSLVGSGSGAVRPGYTPNTKPLFDSNSYESIAKIKLTAGRFLPFNREKLTSFLVLCQRI